MRNISESVVRSASIAFCLSFVCSMVVFLDRSLLADENDQRHLVNFSLNAVFQGEDVDLPEDFIARVEDGKLKVILESLGAQGQRSVRSNLLVSLLDEDGVKQVATTNSSGIAQFTNVRVDALHALLINDENFHAAIPILSVSPEKALEKNLVASDVRLAPMPADRDAILTSLASSSSPTSSVGAVMGVGDFMPSSVSAYRVHLRKDGTLDGRVVVADRDLDRSQRYASITIFRDRQTVARATASAEDGSFGLPNLAVGAYGVIASGPAGYSAFEFEVLPASAALAMPKDRQDLPVSLQPPAASSKLYVFLIPPKLMVRVRDEITNAYGVEPIPTNMAAGPTVGFPGGGGFGGGGGGFGGGGGSGIGGGGFGGGGALAVAGIVAALATSGNNSTTSTNQPPVIVSPITP
ncbi:MAG: carboxypeptidase-like regulatory domain-containing protein [Planctomycetota bacterium]|nr:carboxypeptidase-like regulatory domain-containing protein [Planctomycetota bacterium]